MRQKVQISKESIENELNNVKSTFISQDFDLNKLGIESPLYVEKMKVFIGLSSEVYNSDNNNNICFSTSLHPDKFMMYLMNIFTNEKRNELMLTIRDTIISTIEMKNNTYLMNIIKGMTLLFKLNTDTYYKTTSFHKRDFDKELLFYDYQRQLIETLYSVIENYGIKGINLWTEYYIYERMYLLVTLIHDCVVNLIRHERILYQKIIDNQDNQDNSYSPVYQYPTLRLTIDEWTTCKLSV